MAPVINNERAKKEWSYLVRVVGEENALLAIDKLAGNRKAFPSNIAKVLNITFPPLVCMEVSEKELKSIRAKGRLELKQLRDRLKI